MGDACYPAPGLTDMLRVAACKGNFGTHVPSPELVQADRGGSGGTLITGLREWA